VNGAGATLRYATAVLGAGHSQHVTQNPEQGHVVGHIDLTVGPIDIERKHCNLISTGRSEHLIAARVD
jgi:hypothetical protein